ncbi:DUF397 domain-containing protein [Streptomyces tsukubensis]|uniref:DUF397 domain-containing protein n=1 Tax=Streptomyces tsukubensis TaxID=83656 RepID=UPI00344F88CA
MIITDQQALARAHAVWRKSSHSGSGEGQCVEIADLMGSSHDGIAVRDSKNPDGPALLFAPSAFAAFITGTRSGGLTV